MTLFDVFWLMLFSVLQTVASYSPLWIPQTDNLIAIGVQYKTRAIKVSEDEVEEKERNMQVMDKPPFFSNLIIPRKLD